MSEWTVVTVLVALLGLFATVAKPIVSLNATIARLGETVERLDARLTELTEHNAAGCQSRQINRARNSEFTLSASRLIKNASKTILYMMQARKTDGEHPTTRTKSSRHGIPSRDPSRRPNTNSRSAIKNPTCRPDTAIT